MAPPTPVRHSDWQALLHRLEDVFGVPVPDDFQLGEIDLDVLWKEMMALQPDLGKTGQFVIHHELQQELAEITGNQPDALSDTIEMRILLPERMARRKAMQELQTRIDWKLPRLGLPIWAQYAWGAFLLVGFVLQFVKPIIGLPLFWGGMLLSFQVEKVAWAFQYKTFGEWVARVVALNWPSIALGAIDNARLQAAYASILEEELGLFRDPFAPLGSVSVTNPWQGWRTQAHLLNGDALRLTLEELEILGERIVMRECLCVGPVAAKPDFFEQRAAFIHESYDADPGKYAQWVMTELGRLDSLSLETELNLWFEEDVFCQVNLWFALARIANQGRSARTFLVVPGLEGPRRPDGFAKLGSEALAELLHQRILLIKSDFTLAQNLWKAYQTDDIPRLQALAQQPATHWRCLPEIVQALIDREPDASGRGKPQRILKAILADGNTDFETIMNAFSEQASIYGYGDLQVKALLHDLGYVLPMSY